jgi:HEAT repeat protein
MSRQCILGAALGLALLAAGPARAQQTGYLGKPLTAWASDLKSDNSVARRSAVFALGKMGSASAGWLPQVMGILREDKIGSVREAAAIAVGDICKGAIRVSERTDILKALTGALASDADPLVKRSAAVALGNLGPDAKDAKAALEQALADANPAVRQNAAWAVGQIKTESAAALKNALKDQDALVVRDAAKSVGLLEGKGHDALPELLGACQHADTEVRKAALGAMVAIVGPEDKEAALTIRKALTDKDVEVRRNAALALGNIGGAEAAEAVPVLVEALTQNTDKELRLNAAGVLKNIGPAAAAALEPLRKALADPTDADLRMNAAVALGGLQAAAEPAFDDLIRVVTNPKEDTKVRFQAAVSLAQIGKVPAAKAAIPTLIGVIGNRANPSRVRERTLWALRVHQGDLMNYPDLFGALAQVVEEPRVEENRMLRYDAAFMLGVFKRAEVPAKTLDVLLEFLKDDTIKVYAGTGATAVGVSEKGVGKGTVVERGKDDGRVMAVQALMRIGPERLKARPDILQQLRALSQNNATLPNLRAKLKEAQDILGF